MRRVYSSPVTEVIRRHRELLVVAASEKSAKRKARRLFDRIKDRPRLSERHAIPSRPSERLSIELEIDKLEAGDFLGTEATITFGSAFASTLRTLE